MPNIVSPPHLMTISEYNVQHNRFWWRLYWYSSIYKVHGHSTDFNVQNMTMTRLKIIYYTCTLIPIYFLVHLTTVMFVFAVEGIRHSDLADFIICGEALSCTTQTINYLMALLPAFCKAKWQGLPSCDQNPSTAWCASVSSSSRLQKLHTQLTDIKV